MVTSLRGYEFTWLRSDLYSSTFVLKSGTPGRGGGLWAIAGVQGKVAFGLKIFLYIKFFKRKKGRE